MVVTNNNGLPGTDFTNSPTRVPGTAGFTNAVPKASPLVVTSGFEQLSASEAAVPVAAPSVGPSLRISQGVNAQSALNSLLPSSSKSEAPTAPVSTDSTSTSTSSTDSASTIPGLVSSQGSTSASTGTGEADVLKEIVDWEKEQGEPGDDTTLYTEAMMIWQPFYKKFENGISNELSQTKKDLANAERRANGEDVEVESVFAGG